MKFKLIQTKIVDIGVLREHEHINNDNYEKLTSEIKQNKYVTPIIVDKVSNIILDGHHRYNVLKNLGYSKIPAYLVDYNSKSIKVNSWRDNITVTKTEVVKRGLTGNLYPAKTSRHIIKDLEKQEISLEQLK